MGLAREPRWGRMNEEFGEDTLLAARLGGAMISGMQSDGDLSNRSAGGDCIDEGLLPLSLSNLIYMDNPYSL